MIKTEIILAMVNAASLAAKKILDVKEQGFDVREKSDFSPVTAADLASEKCIKEFLEPLGIPIMSEEGAETPYSERKHWSHCFIVDPLDGTNEFISDSKEYGVNIAYVVNGEPVFGVIALPETSELYYGGKGFKARRSKVLPGKTISSLNDLEYETLPLRKLPENYVVLASKSAHCSNTAEYYKALREVKKDLEILPVGSCLKYCFIAQGRAHEYTRYHNVMEWDTAAGDAILRSLGMPICSIASGEPLIYNKEETKSSNFRVLWADG